MRQPGRRNWSDGLGLLSQSLSAEAKRRWPWLALSVDLLVVAGQLQLLYWIVQAVLNI